MIKIGPLSSSRNELTDIAKGWIAISVAFAIVLGGFSLDLKFLFAVFFAGITVGIGFLFHELAHKIVAQRYGCFAEFRAFDAMLILAVALSFLGFIFAAPGAVMIAGQVTRRENGWISVVGSWTNIVLALIFLLISKTIPQLQLLGAYGFQINAWLAAFNMIPFWILDGKKVFLWNKTVWALTLLTSIGLMIVF
jgi:Zn-dependent protease